MNNNIDKMNIYYFKRIYALYLSSDIMCIFPVEKESMFC